MDDNLSKSFLQLGLPRDHIKEVFSRLKSGKKLIFRKKDLLLMEALEELHVVYRSGRYWHLSSPETLQSLINRLNDNTAALVKPSAVNSVMRQLSHIHHKTASAWRGDSKSGKSKPLAHKQVVTSDDIVRIRSQQTGLVFSYQNKFHGSWQQDIDLETQQRTECNIAERLWLEYQGASFQDDFQTTSSQQQPLLLTVENLGSFVDLPLQDNLIIMFVPGLNIIAASRLIKALVPTIRWLHFPDLDGNGLTIATQLADKIAQPCRIWLPDYWQDQARQRGKDLIGANKHNWEQAPALKLPGLRDQERWLEQETLVLDQRCDRSLATLLNNEQGAVYLKTKLLK